MGENICNLDCLHCTIPASKCNGGPSRNDKTPYTPGTQPTRKEKSAGGTGVHAAYMAYKNGSHFGGKP